MTGLIAAFLGAAAVFGILYTLAATACFGRFFARPKPAPVAFPALTVLRPLRGAEWGLLRNLESFCGQDYPGTVQHVFGVSDAEDPALKAVEKLRSLCPAADITVVADPRLHGTNRKVSNTINMLREARHDVLVFADSDVGVDPDYLRQAVSALQKPGVGLVTCLYRGAPDPGFWPRLSALATNYQFIPSVVMGLALGRARPCLGQTIMIRRETLDGIGGFPRFANHLAEDHAIGEAVRLAGFQVEIPPVLISHACAETNPAKLVTHELRWSRTIRAVDPAGYAGSVLIHPIPFALLAVLASSGATWSWLVAAAAVAARLALKLGADRVLRQPLADLILLPFWDLASFGIYLASFLSTRVTWRGLNFNVGRDGLLSPVTDK